MLNGKQRSPAREEEKKMWTMRKLADRHILSQQTSEMGLQFTRSLQSKNEVKLVIKTPTKLAEIQRCRSTLRWEPCLYALWQGCDKWHCFQKPYSNWNHAYIQAKKSTPESLFYRTKAPGNADARIKMMAALLMQEGPWERKIHTAGNGWACYYTPTLWNYTVIRRTKTTRQLEKKLGTFQKIATSQNFLYVYIYT